MTKNKHGKLIVISPYFNPLGWKSRPRLFKEFIRYVEYSGARLLIVEVAYGNLPFEVTEEGNPMHLRLRSNANMWHKERAINIGIQYLIQMEPETDKIAWIDGDVTLSNTKWAHDTLFALEHYDVIQLFSHSSNLGPENEHLHISGSVFYNFVNKIFKDNNIGTFKPYIAMGHPGLAWAATISALNKLGGLIDYCVHGSGDSHMANALMGDVRSYYQTRLPSNGLLSMLDQWEARATKHIQQNVGYLSGVCYHYWHGKMRQRAYKERWDIVCDHDYDPATDIYAETNGLYQFTGNKKQFEYDLRTAMLSRNEDSVDL